MNDNACNDPTEQPVSLKYEVIPDATVFSGDTPAPTATAASVSTIVAGDHIPPSGPKRQTKPFYPVNMKNITKKYPICTAVSKQISWLDSLQLPIFIEKLQFLTSSTSTKNISKKTK